MTELHCDTRENEMKNWTLLANLYTADDKVATNVSHFFVFLFNFKEESLCSVLVDSKSSKLSTLNIQNITGKHKIITGITIKI